MMCNRNSADGKSRLPLICLTGVLLILIGSIFLLASVPPVDRDALTHHLAVPKLYLNNGGIYEIPSVPFSYYPMNLDLLYMIPLYFGNDIFPKYIHFAFALLTAWLIFQYVRRRVGVSYAMAGALLFLSLPVIIKLSITVYVDLGLIFFSTAALLRLLRWAETDFRLRHLLAAGVLAGLCLGTKINGMLAVFLLTLGVPFICRRSVSELSASDSKRRNGPVGEGMALRPLAWAVGFAVVAAMVYSPWMVRNAVWTANPFYPMATNLFGADRTPGGQDAFSGRKGDGEVEQERTRRGSGFGHFAVRKVVFGESLWEIMAIPIRIFFEGRDDDPRLFDGRLSPYLLIFPLIALYPLKSRRR